ncbi:helix-turn-helix domain-containing protein [Saliphagus infecundisoli]|uniref:Helix-turn-helix domain-containing protein n=1 Tax=Saliphagus infecundisoli TaxID=1849069 RepID=A0ABD5QDY8_9EURY|nr:helix-turn-helix domain-containing protein [Saliphagus infecundisoli]
MTMVTKFSVPIEDVMLSETFSRLPDLQIRVKRIVADGSTRILPLVWLTGGSKREIEAALTDDTSVEGFRCLLQGDEDSEWLYHLEYGADSETLFSTIFANDGTILDAACSASNWTFRLLFPDRSLLSETVPTLESQGLRVDITRLMEAERKIDLMTTTLTEAQEEAIRAAYELGYYDVPRRISLEDLATELEISHQALSERLRRANKVLASERIDEPSQNDIVH